MGGSVFSMGGREVKWHRNAGGWEVGGGVARRASKMGWFAENVWIEVTLEIMVYM